MSCWRSTTSRRTSRERGPATEILRPLLADRGELHVELRPQPLGAELHVLQHLGRVGGGGGDDVAVLGEARGGAVVQHQPVLAQHQAVARLADGQGLPAVGVEAVEELGRVRALQVDLAERGHIAHADAGAHGAHLAVDAAEPVGLAGPRIPLRAQPVARLDEHGAVLLRPSVRRRQPRRPEVLAAVRARQRADRDRREGRAEGGRAGLRDGLGGELGHQREAGDVGGLALVGGHAERGVALEVLDRAEALVAGERHVVVGDVVLQIDERLAARTAHAPQRRGGRALRVDVGDVDGLAAGDRSRRPPAGRPWRRRPGRPPGPARRWRRRLRPCRPAACRARRRRGDRSRRAARPDARSDARTGSSRPTRTRDRNRSARSRRPRSARRPRARGWSRCARVTAPPAIRRAPAALAAASMLPGTFARGSTTAATAMPARARSATVRAVSSLVPNTTARRPGATA